MNNNEKLLQALINDPLLLKTIEKLAKSAPTIKKEKKLSILGNPTYINEVSVKCKLCGSVDIVYLEMAYDKEDKLYRCGKRYKLYPTTDLPIYSLIQRTPSCLSCPGLLALLPVESLISKIINLANSH